MEQPLTFEKEIVKRVEEILEEAGRDYGDIPKELKRLLEEIGMWQEKCLGYEISLSLILEKVNDVRCAINVDRGTVEKKEKT